MDQPPPLAARNQHVQALRRLCTSRAERDATGLVVVEGRVLAAEVLALAGVGGGAHVLAVYADPALDVAVELARAAEALGANWHAVDTGILDRVGDAATSQGIALVVQRPSWSAHDLGAGGLVLALDGLADPGNVGTVLRTAAAVGAAGVVVACGADPFAPKVVRSARAVQLSLPTIEVDDLAATLASGLAGARQVAIAAADGRPLWAEALAEDLVLVIGNEADGVSEALQAIAQDRLAIAMPGGTESLNAGVAASVLAYEWLRCRHDA